MFKIKANKASLIMVTRNNPADLQTAIRNVFDKMDNFNVSDIEYTIDDSAEGTKYSALILGGLDDGYVDVSDDGGTDTPEPEPTPTEEDTKTTLKELQQKQEETNQALDELRQQVAAILALLQQNSGN